MKKKLRMFLCAALTASMMATAPALVQSAEEKRQQKQQKAMLSDRIWLA